MKQDDCVIVTGAGGLVGSAVVEYLHERCYTRVVGLTRSDCDLMDFEATAKLFANIRPAHVFHAAARVYGIIGNMNNQAKSFLENTRINVSIVDAAYRSGAKKITVMGTNCIYPSPPVLPYKEDAIFDGRPDTGEAAYGHAKRGMLAMLEAYQDSYGMEWCYLVSGNLFGPRDRFDPINGHVIPSLIWKFYEASIGDKPIELLGDGTPERDFLYVKDLARIVHLVMDSNARGAINVGHCDRGSRISDVVNTLCQITGVSESRVHWNPDKPNGRLRCFADLRLLRHLGFVPAYSLEDGLKETWGWYRGKRASENVDWTLQTR